jgi:translation initiation factor RLI1
VGVRGVIFNWTCSLAQEITKALLESVDEELMKEAEILRALLPSGISHTTIHRLVGKVTDSSLKAEEKEIEEVYEGGVISESEGKVVSHLFVEADGTNIALQREEARRAEVKAGIAYEDWHKVTTCDKNHRAKLGRRWQW